MHYKGCGKCAKKHCILNNSQMVLGTTALHISRSIATITRVRGEEDEAQLKG